MKKFQFSLEKVLGFKSQTRDVLKNELATLNHELSIIEDKIKELQTIFADTNHKMIADMSEGVTAANIGVFKIYLNDISVQITRKREDKEKKMKQIVTKQRQIIASNVEIASLDKLKEKQMEEYRLMSAKAQEIEINEFIINSTSF